jgi:hypothetical protein
MFIENPVMTGTEELLAIGNPADAAAKMRADIRHRMIIASILCQNKDAHFLFIDYPAILARHPGFEECRYSQFYG